MKQGEDFKGCRYFGYRPASEEFLHKSMNRTKKDAVRAKHKADVVAIRAKGCRPTNYGYKTRELATAAAKAIEEISGVEMMIFNHDYM
jgi:hypothetical protein